MRFVAGFVFICMVSWALSDKNSKISIFMKYLNIIPDVINEGPTNFLKVSYDSGVTADKGIELTPTQVKDEPTVTWKSEYGALYTLLMIDADGESFDGKPNKSSEFLHWLVINIEENNLCSGQLISPYIGSIPSKGTGLHRYVFLLFKQTEKYQYAENLMIDSNIKGRTNFSSKKFALKYNLGKPLAGNFFQAQYDETVSQMQKALGL